MSQNDRDTDLGALKALTIAISLAPPDTVHEVQSGVADLTLSPPSDTTDQAHPPEVAQHGQVTDLVTGEIPRTESNHPLPVIGGVGLPRVPIETQFAAGIAFPPPDPTPRPVLEVTHSPPHFSDPTGQICPPGTKRRVAATLWEDEGSLVFHVKVNNISVARREDDHRINGSALLNVARWRADRRDSFLASETEKHVVEDAPTHLKGVWIPFHRALEIANQEGITERLYPLFVYNIGGLLYHPVNSAPVGPVGDEGGSQVGNRRS